MARIRGRKPERRQARIGAPDAALTANGGMAAISELCERLRVIEAIDAAAGPIKQRDRGYGAGQLLAGIAAAQLAGEDFLAGLDRQRADVAGQQLTPVPGCPRRPLPGWPAGSGRSSGRPSSAAWPR